MGGAGGGSEWEALLLWPSSRLEKGDPTACRAALLLPGVSRRVFPEASPILGFLLRAAPGWALCLGLVSPRPLPTTMGPLSSALLDREPLLAPVLPDSGCGSGENFRGGPHSHQPCCEECFLVIRVFLQRCKVIHSSCSQLSSSRSVKTPAENRRRTQTEHLGRV